MVEAKRLQSVTYESMIPAVVLPMMKARVGDVWINEHNFPDPSFREYVKTLPRSNQDKFTKEELKQIKVIACDGYYLEEDQKIRSLKGIEYFQDVETITLSGNELTSLELDHPMLKMLRCNDNRLQCLEVKSATLRYLNCEMNELHHLSLDCEALELLYCANNHLKTLDTSSLLELKALYASGNHQIELDLNKNALLEECIY